MTFMMNRQGATTAAGLSRFLIMAALAAFLTACGLTAPRGNEGFADLDSLGFGDTDRVLSLSIGPALLHFAANHIDDEPETRELLRSLDGVRIRIYEIDGDAGRVASRLNSMSSDLKNDGWEPVMTVRDDNETVHMLLRMVDERICGMTVLVSDGKSEAVIINLMGDIKPEQFSEVMVALDVDAAGVKDVESPSAGES
jgi:hypothetical protein